MVNERGGLKMPNLKPVIPEEKEITKGYKMMIFIWGMLSLRRWSKILVENQDWKNQEVTRMTSNRISLK